MVRHHLDLLYELAIFEILEDHYLFIVVFSLLFVFKVKNITFIDGT